MGVSTTPFSLILADVHLDSRNSELCSTFRQFLEERAQGAEALYILGDLFEAWLGDDAPEPGLQPVFDALKTLTANGTVLYLQHGNRDFLLGHQFCRQLGGELAPEILVTEIHGHRLLLLHGDQLCTDDLEYQKFRTEVRAPEQIAFFLSKTVEERLAIARHYRSVSMENKLVKDAALMDVNRDEVIRRFTEHQVATMVHGHTHRPDVHDYTVAGRRCRRVVVGDWTPGGVYAVVDGAGVSLQRFPTG